MPKWYSRFIETPGQEESLIEEKTYPGDGSAKAYRIARKIEDLKIELLVPMHPYRKEAIEDSIKLCEEELAEMSAEAKKKSSYTPGAVAMIFLMSGLFK